MGCRNHALGKPYTFQPAAAVDYPDTWDAELTDELDPASWPLDRWVAWNAAGSITVTVDLQFPRPVRKVTAQVHAHGDFGFHFPTAATVDVSDDGTTFRPFAAMTVPVDPALQTGV